MTARNKHTTPPSLLKNIINPPMRKNVLPGLLLLLAGCSAKLDLGGDGRASQVDSGRQPDVSPLEDSSPREDHAIELGGDPEQGSLPGFDAAGSIEDQGALAPAADGGGDDEDPDPPDEEECEPQCEGRDCGADGCGGSCGTCGNGQKCDKEGRCAADEEGRTCDPNKNALTTGKSEWDAYDCQLLALAQKYGHPDARILKTQLKWESQFVVFETSHDSPCGIKSGWSDAESKSFGLFQVTPACGEGKRTLLPNGHPNLTKDTSSKLWATSIFNPAVNLDEGVKSITEGNLVHAREAFPNCTERQQVLIAAAFYVDGWDAVSGCTSFAKGLALDYVNAILNEYRRFAALGGWPNPYPHSF